MEKLSFNEIIDLLKERFGRNLDEVVYFEDDTIEGIGQVNDMNANGKLPDGDEWWKVLHFVDHDIYIKFEGWHSSYDGVTVDEWYEVEPHPETVINYKKVNN